MVMDGSASKLYSQTDIARITNTTKIRVSRFLKKHHYEGIRQETALLYHQDALDAYKKYLESQKEKDEKRAKLPSKEALYHQLVTTQAEQNRRLEEQNQALMQMVNNQSKQIENYTNLFKQQQAQIDSLKELVKKLPEPDKSASEKDKIDYDKLSESFTKAFENLKNESEDDKKGGFWSNLFH